MSSTARGVHIPALAALLLGACSPAANDGRLVGQLESERIELVAEFAEPVIERAVAEGAEVVAGQVLVRQDTARIDASMLAADASRAQAEARLDELVRGPRREQIHAARAAVEGASKELEFRETDLKRAEDVFVRNLSSAELRDRARAARDAAKSSLDVAAARLDELLSGTTAEELRQAEQRLREAEARLQSLQIDRDRHTTLAPVAGVVDTLLFEVGERPVAGQPLAIVLAGQQVYARIYVPEALRVRVAPGSKAIVHVDGMPQPLHGRVRWVSSEAAFTPYFALTEDDRGRLSYAAKVDIDDAQDRLPDGVPVEVELLLDQDGS